MTCQLLTNCVSLTKVYGYKFVEDNPMAAPLDGIKILDLSRVLSGPYATMTMADLGADVVKVERPCVGDDTRAFGPPFVDGVSTYFLSVNRGKRSICLDLKDAGDREFLIRLVEKADCLVENFRPGVMKRLGLGRATLHKVNPRLVYCSISGFGSENEGPGYDVMIQGLSGIPSITGDGDQPFKCGASIADIVSGMNAVQGILAALFRRERDGQGSFVDISMLDGQLSLLTYHASAYLNGGIAPRALGNSHPSIHPFGTFRSADGHLNIAIGNDRLFESFCEGVGVGWHRDSLYMTNAARVENRDALQALMEALVAERTTEQWADLLSGLGIPNGEVKTVPEALKGARIISHPHPNGSDTVRSVASPVTVSDAATGAALPPPRLGEHQAEVARRWGLDE